MPGIKKNSDSPTTSDVDVAGENYIIGIKCLLNIYACKS